MTTDLEAHLPLELRGPSTTITRVAAGLSGAGVYRVESSGTTYVMKVARDDQPIAEWRRRLHVQQLAASAGVAPRIVHVDERRRVTVSAFVVDRSFPMLFFNPATRADAIALLGGTLRRVHEIPLPADASAQDGRGLLVNTWAALESEGTIPAFVADIVRRVLATDPPPSGRAVVLSHNDVNPTNLVYDGEHLLLFDWDTAGPNDPFYDLAAIAVFLRMDDDTCRKLIEAHDGEPLDELPARFLYDRRLAATMCGSIFLSLATQGGHPGANGTETLEHSLSMAEVYQRMRAGALNVASPEGQWAFGLALLKAGASL